GNNLLTPPERDPLWKLFLEKFEDPIIRILLIAAFLSLIISVVHNDYAETMRDRKAAIRSILMMGSSNFSKKSFHSGSLSGGVSKLLPYFFLLS
ncbi:MAG: cation-transporting P-type ATPase, partial [Imperialibacter sp.]